MTTNYHTAIATGAAANASTFNTPLGTLDAQITANAAAITANALLAAATTAEVVAARNAHASLDTRLDFMETVQQLAGGNVATKANGVSAAGQKVLTVDSTTGFIVGAYVAYLLNGATLEGNTIGSIQAGVSLTLGTNIGAAPAGGVLDDTYISMISTSEYLAAQAIPHTAGTALMLPSTIEYTNGGIFNVAAYGGLTLAALNAAWTALSDGCVLRLEAGGVYEVTDTVTWQDKSNITIIGNGATIKPAAGSNFTGKAVVDFAGSQYCVVGQLLIDSTLASNEPAAGLVLARYDAGDGGSNRFDNCNFDGTYTHSVVYDCGSEVSSFWNCRFVTRVAGIPCYYTSSTDDASLSAQDSVSNVRKQWYACTLLDYSNTATGQVLIEAQGVTKELVFRDCYCGLTGGGKVINLAGTSASMNGLVIDNMRVEGVNHASSRLLYCGQDVACGNIRMTGIVWSIESDYVIEVPAGTSTINYSYFELLHDLPGTTKWMHISESLVSSYIIIRDAASISVDTTKSAYTNFIVCFGGDPLTGAGYIDSFPRQDNIIASLYDSVSYLAAPRAKVTGRYIDGHSATPAVSGSSLISLQQDQATDVTNFSGMVNGQEITLIAENANTTLKHGATIKLAGAADYIVPAGGTITLVYFAYKTAWYEKTRMVPS